ncbi:hypothetical protein BSI_17670 [Bacillus inaquosorum KCTC 13429]|uniref:Uncharacterized protein n=1 Tax=Bacillus inaquosorum KCTC 13429 TaxID=1236548 RepID=A0A9W5PD95_9BACI|nr:hypothetical protein BSI_17670 [Bacillus inaquosorum KCTC 13429]
MIPIASTQHLIQLTSSHLFVNGIGHYILQQPFYEYYLNTPAGGF